MFGETSSSRKAIGDVDVVFHDGLYHLFHLVLPNHDFIAHAISDNAINWRRVDNALFIGNPGSWDDLMLWTMHVSPDPHQNGRWRMFYTGLSRRDQGMVQRLGMATSGDLYRWKKSTVNWEDLRGAHDPETVKAAMRDLIPAHCTLLESTLNSASCFPLSPDPEFYEADLDGERGWISFRDPFYFRSGDQGWLLAAARVNHGPLVRRGCVAALEEIAPNQFVAIQPLHFPQLYDDVEVPNLIKLADEFYLIGSIREDAKIRYWHTDDVTKPWRNYYDNVLLPKGNYAGRVCNDERGLLLFNFYTQNLADRTNNNIMPPPKRLSRCENGQLKVTSYEGLAAQINGAIDTRCLSRLKADRKESFCQTGQGVLNIASEAGFQAFVFEEEVTSFRLRANFSMVGRGKCGLLFRIDPYSHDGYYVSLDLMKGLAQFRSWGTGAIGSGEHMMQFRSLQSGNWFSSNRQSADVELISFGSYHELSIDGTIVLSLADARFRKGLLGIYVETATLNISQLTAETMADPAQTDEHLSSG